MPPLVITAWGRDSTWHRASAGHCLGEGPLCPTQLLLRGKHDSNRLGGEQQKAWSLGGTLVVTGRTGHAQMAEITCSVPVLLEPNRCQRKEDLPDGNNQDLHSPLNSGH